jgi:hypothetical protein
MGLVSALLLEIQPENITPVLKRESFAVSMGQGCEEVKVLPFRFGKGKGVGIGFY